MVSTDTGGCPGEDSQSHSTELEIPKDLVESNDLFCSVVQVTYGFTVVAQLSGFSKNVSVEFPVTILSIPFAEDKLQTQISKAQQTLVPPTGTAPDGNSYMPIPNGYQTMPIGNPFTFVPSAEPRKFIDRLTFQGQNFNLFTFHFNSTAKI